MNSLQHQYCVPCGCIESNKAIFSLFQPHFPIFGTKPKKSILKKTNSWNMRNFSPIITPSVTPYTTVTGAESRYGSMDVKTK